MSSSEHWQQPESQTTKLSRSKAAAPAQPAICCLERIHSCDEFTEGGRQKKRRGCLFLLPSQMLAYSHFLSSCWIFREFGDLGGAKEMWVIQHPCMNLPHLLPLSAVHVCWAGDFSLKNWWHWWTARPAAHFTWKCLSRHTFKRSFFQGQFYSRKIFFSLHNKSCAWRV